MSNNPITKSEALKIGFRSLPDIPSDAALVLYPHNAKSSCRVYMLDDIVDKKQIKKEHFDRLAHVSFQQFQFPYALRVPFAEGAGRYCTINYNITVSVKRDSESVKKIIQNNITDISEPIINLLNGDALQLEGSYSCKRYQELETALFRKINDVVSQISYLKIGISQTSVERDVVSNKIIEDHVAHELERARLMAEEEKLKIQQEEAKIRKKEADIARIKAENYADLAQIRRQQEMEEKDHEIKKKIKDLEAEKDYDVKRIERVAVVAEKDKKLREDYTIEELAAVDDKFAKFAQLQQEKIDRERDNASKNFDYYMKIIEEIKSSEMDDSFKDELMRKMFSESSTLKISQQSNHEIPEYNDHHNRNDNQNEIEYDYDGDVREMGEDTVK
ncbi:MAG: hypothetical protein K2O91_27405 [Lachnospiraceae bacterium]|nr:hypothetical protein [Lachnospiraceae bacterium]